MKGYFGQLMNIYYHQYHLFILMKGISQDLHFTLEYNLNIYQLHIKYTVNVKYT